MPRQHAAPILIPAGNGDERPLVQRAWEQEASIRDLIHRNPGVLPIGEIDPAFVDPVALCTELNTPAGPIDNFMVTASGMPVIVECKLWRNPQARREVVGQVLDYAKELSRWTSADIEREVSRRGVGSVAEAVSRVHPGINEADFHDALSLHLSRGRCLLLIVGDGIRQGTEAIFEHLRDQAALHFSLGLVELPIYEVPGGDVLVLPRVLTRASVHVREVVQLPEGVYLRGSEGDIEGGAIDPQAQVASDERLAFWTDFHARLQLDDPDQPIHPPSRLTYATFHMPAPESSAWIVVYWARAKGEVGVFLTGKKDTVGRRAVDAIIDEWNESQARELGGEPRISSNSNGRTIQEARRYGDLHDPDKRRRTLDWLAERTNAFVNMFRPAVRAAVEDR